MHYYLSIGTNINPRHNAVAIVKALCTNFGELQLYPFVATVPEAIEDDSEFLNSFAVIESPLSATQIKSQLNTIEEGLGRDRQDPDKKTKSRTADIDILGDELHTSTRQLQLEEPLYVSQAIAHSEPAIDLTTFGLPYFNQPVFVQLDAERQHLVIKKGA